MFFHVVHRALPRYRVTFIWVVGGSGTEMRILDSGRY